MPMLPPGGGPLPEPLLLLLASLTWAPSSTQLQATKKAQKEGLRIYIYIICMSFSSQGTFIHLFPLWLTHITQDITRKKLTLPRFTWEIIGRRPQSSSSQVKASNL